MTYTCTCCYVRKTDDTCSCVYTLCRRCLHCLTHCWCAHRRAQGCEPDPELDAEGSPFSDFSSAPAKVEN
jgi:hypothetical protein